MLGRGVHSGETKFLPNHDDRTLWLSVVNSVAGAAEEPARCSAKLMNNLKSLHTLWNEYETCIGGNKPAKLFNHKEKGRTDLAIQNIFFFEKNIGNDPFRLD